MMTTCEEHVKKVEACEIFVHGNGQMRDHDLTYFSVHDVFWLVGEEVSFFVYQIHEELVDPGPTDISRAIGIILLPGLHENVDIQLADR